MTVRTASMLLVALLILAACAAPAGTPSPSPARTARPTDEPAAQSKANLTPAPGATLDDDAYMMAALIPGNRATIDAALSEITAAGDTRFVPVLIELMRAAQIGLIGAVGYGPYIETLQDLSGQQFGDDWPAWVEWYGATDIAPPPGFTGWKGRLLGGIDPGFAQFLRDDLPARIRVAEIQWGGVPVDGIPALDNAPTIPAAEAGYLTPKEPVFGLSVNGDHRAYPLRILDWHEMANDVVGGVPVSLAYCTLCGAGIAYDGRASDGNTYDFGSSGFLYRSNKLMYDRQTRTLWNQLTGEPVLGELAGRDITLDLLPVVVTTWADWQTQHPDTLVLSLETGYSRPYEPGAAYGDYFADAETMFPVWQRSSLLPAKARIYALQVDGVPKAYPVETLAAERVVNDAVGDQALALIAGRGDITVDGESRRSGAAVRYGAGAEVRAYARGDQAFSPGPEPDVLLDSEGRPWRVTEEALVGPDGERLARVNGHLAYWFGWYSFFPNTLLYKGDG